MSALAITIAAQLGVLIGCLVIGGVVVGTMGVAAWLLKNL